MTFLDVFRSLRTSQFRWFRSDTLEQSTELSEDVYVVEWSNIVKTFSQIADIPHSINL